MPSNALFRPLGEVAAECSARFGARSDQLNVAGVDSKLGITQQTRYQAAELSRYKLLGPGMFAYNPMRLNIGAIGMLPLDADPVLVSPDYMVFSCGADLLPEYLSYFTKTAAWANWTSAAGTGSVRSRIYFKELAKMPVPVPPVPQQQAALNALKPLDALITSLRGQNSTIEALTESLFRSWFVDFDPVKAKAANHPPPCVPAELLPLIPSEFEHSELGPIPKGWRARSLDSIANYLNGLALQKFRPAENEDSLPVVKIAQLRAGHAEGAERASRAIKPEYILADGDVLFSWSGSLEVEFWCGGPGALNQHLFKVTSTEVPKWFYFLATRKHLPSFRHSAENKATTMGHIQRKHLTAAKIAVPPPEFIAACDSSFAPFIEARVRNSVRIQTLTGLRTALLSRLSVGKLHIPDALAAVEEATA